MSLKFSPSSLNTFFQCPRRWYYQRTHAPQNLVDDRRALLGSAIHGMIEVYFTRQKERPTLHDVEKLAWEIFNTTYDPVIKEFESLSKRLWTNFIKFEKERLKSWRIYKPELVEASFELTSGLRGIVDFYGDNKIIDWKTGTFYYMTKDYVRQGNIYRYMLTRAGYKVDDVLFVFLRDLKVVKIPNKGDGWVEEEVRKVKAMIDKGYFPKKPSKLCNYCEYRLVCEFSEDSWTELGWFP